MSNLRVTRPGSSAPGGPDSGVPVASLYQSLLWLSRLLTFRLSADSSEQSPSRLFLDDLNQELAEACGVPHEPPSAPPPLLEGGWLPELCRRFRMTPMEGLLVVAALAPTVDGRFAQAYGRFLGLERPERPTVDLIGRLLAFSLADRTRLASCIRAGSTLHRYGLLAMDWTDNAILPVNHQPLAVPDRIRWYLLEGLNELAPSLAPLSILSGPRFSLQEAPLEPSLIDNLRRVLETLHAARQDGSILPLIVMEGLWGIGQSETASALASELNLNVLEVSIGRAILSSEPADLSMQLRREAILQNAVLLLRIQADDQDMDRLYDRARTLLDLDLRELPLPIVATGNLATLTTLKDLTRPAFRFELRLPSRALQRHSLLHALQHEALEVDPGGLEELLNRYNLDLTGSRDIVRTAYTLSRSLRSQSQVLEGPELESAVEVILRRYLSELAQRLSARYTWADLVVSEEIQSQLKTLRNLIEHKHLVFETWGLGRKGGSGTGIKAIFSGPSGTGKTMAAEVIANDLRLPIYRVDLSSIVSKWVGETEKNLEKIFREAQGSQAILLFDEADALFGKRGKVDSANDRHANIEVSFLLQRFEVHDGVVILTTNFPTVIDTAFSRRMHFQIEFESPDEPTRKILWEKLLIPSLPKSQNIDIPYLAQRFEISGANIKNVVLGAAFIAAAGGQEIGMREIGKAMQWEYQKLGRTVSFSDFDRFIRR